MSDECYLGLMSGTSADGLDAALVRFEDSAPELLRHSCTPFSSEMKAELAALRTRSDDEIAAFGRLDRQLAELCAQAALGLAGSTEVRAIGWLGHTVRHCPEEKPPFTLQAGDCATIAQLTGTTVVGEFRRCDVAAGGQGAPFAPIFHRAFFAHPKQQRAVLNLGGIANLSLLEDGRVRGFDTGPASCLMDEWTNRHLKKPFDRDGEWAAGGQVIGKILDRLLRTGWLSLPPPKSTGRELFHIGWLDDILSEFQHLNFSAQDLQATLAAFTARTICDALKAQSGAKQLFVCGGGAKNAHLMALLKDSLKERGVSVQSTQALGMDVDWVEATGVAWLAKERLEENGMDMFDVTGGTGRHPGVVFTPD